MDNQKLKTVLEAAFPNASVSVNGDGYHHQVDMVSDVFEGLSRVKRSQMVYQALDSFITTGELHALKLVTKTPQE